MSDYTKISDFTAKDAAEALIVGVDFDNEFTAIADMSATKMDVTVPAAANSVAGLDVSGNPYDTTVLVADMVTAINSPGITGEVKLWTTNTVPSGWAFCDGTSYTTASQPDLFAVLAYAYGGSGANFNVPDMRGRVPVGQDDMGGTSANRVTASAADAIAGTGGSETHTLTSSEMPSHTHTGTTNSDGTHNHDITYRNSVRDVGGSGNCSRLDSTEDLTNTTHIQDAGAHTHSFTTASAGSGNAHTNMQPWMTMNYIIKL